MHPSTFIPLLMLLILAGCHSRPVRVAMRGDIDGNIDGNVGVRGDLNLDGKLSTTVKSDNTASPLRQVSVEGQVRSGGGRIAIIDVDGLLVHQNLGGLGSLSENPAAMFREKMRCISDDSRVAAVVLRIDSPGGGVTAADMMSHELNRFQQTTGVPVVACLLGHGAGGAYYLATHCDQIVAQPTSIVGGIGVILNLYNMEDTLGQYNIAAIPVKAGESIDAGSPVRTMEMAELARLQAIADSFHQRFIEQVIRGRPGLLPPESSQQVRDWFDGRVVTGDEAAASGLVDRVGYVDDAISLARAMGGLDDSAGVVMLRRDNDRAHTALDITPTQSNVSSLLPLNVPGLDRAKLPTFMYLWQLEPSYATR